MAYIPSRTRGTLEDLWQVLRRLSHDNICVDGGITQKLLERPDTAVLREAVQRLHSGYAKLQEHFGKPPHSLKHLDYLFLRGSRGKRDLYWEMLSAMVVPMDQAPLSETDKEVLATTRVLQEEYLQVRSRILAKVWQEVL